MNTTITLDGNTLALSEAVSAKPAGSAVEADLERVRVNNRLRGTIEAAVGSLTLMSPNAGVRLSAADALFKRRDATALAALEQALATEKDPRIKRAMSEAPSMLHVRNRTRYWQTARGHYSQRDQW